MPIVHATHGVDGDGCYSSKSCGQVRHRILQGAVAKIQTRIDRAIKLEKLDLDVPQPYYSLLKFWREDRSDSPLHAIGAEIWQGNTQISEIAPVHCLGWQPKDCIDYAVRMLDALRDQYGIRSFVDDLIVPPDKCLILEGCYYQRSDAIVKQKLTSMN